MGPVADDGIACGEPDAAFGAKYAGPATFDAFQEALGMKGAAGLINKLFGGALVRVFEGVKPAGALGGLVEIEDFMEENFVGFDGAVGGRQELCASV